MKKLLSILGVLVLLVGLVGCSGNGVVPPPEEIPFELIREYTGRDQVVRWPDGEVSVVDFTGKTETIWNKINKIIEGPVVFQLTSNPEAAIGIEYLPIDYPFFCGAGIENFVFLWFGLGIRPGAEEDIYIQVCLIGAGIKEEKAAEGFSEEIEEVLYWLYRLEPGYPLL
ncbi:MAG: hypothetical protein AB7D02_02770 [Candidatus Paceibacterota bacterium]|jgi:hypothetical protein